MPNFIEVVPNPSGEIRPVSKDNSSVAQKKKDWVYVSGKVKWFQAHRPNEYGDWTHILYPDPESLEKIRELQAEGIKNHLKKDDDGWFVRFKRASSKLINGKLIPFAAPEVVLSDGTTPLRNTLVGNGSDITTKLEVYKHKTPNGGSAKAAKWYSTRIDNLIPFDGKRDFDEATQVQIEGLAEQPKPKNNPF